MNRFEQWFAGVITVLVVVGAAPAQFRMDDFEDMMPPRPGGGRGLRGRGKPGKLIGGSVLDMARELKLSRATIKKVQELLKDKDEKAAKREEIQEIRRERLRDSISRARNPKQRKRLQDNLRKIQERQRLGKTAEREEKACAQKIIVLLTERQRTIWNRRNLTRMVLGRLRGARLDRDQQDQVETICKEVVKKIKTPTDVRFTTTPVSTATKQIVAKVLTPRQKRQYNRQIRQERERERRSREARRSRRSSSSRGRRRSRRSRGRSRY